MMFQPLLKFMITLTIVYWAEYLINQGLVSFFTEIRINKCFSQRLLCSNACPASTLLAKVNIDGTRSCINWASSSLVPQSNAFNCRLLY
jgi:hypothetical protein